MLDADDRFKPHKLEQAVAALQHHAIVSVALEEFDDDRIGGCGWWAAGPDRELTPAVYKWTCLSMDSMLGLGPPQDRRALRSRAHQHDRPRFAAAALPDSPAKLASRRRRCTTT